MGKHKKTVDAGKINIKKGDKVMVITGKDSGKGEKSIGEVVAVFPKKNKVLVEGLNIAKKHTKPTENNPGGINDINLPIHISNVMLIDPKTGNPTRVGRKLVDGKLVRYAKKSGEVIS